MTVTICPAMVMLPLRADPGLALTVNPTDPLPEPAPPPVSTIQPSLVAALHEQPASVVTLTVPFPPDAPMACDMGLSV